MSNGAEWIAYVGPFSFPWGYAGSRRVYGMVSSLAAAGRQVVVASGDVGPDTLTRLEVEGPGSVWHIGLGELPSGSATLAEKAVQILVRWGHRTVQWLDAQETKPSHVVTYGGEAQYQYRLRQWCGRHGIPLIADVADWYNGRYVGAGGYFGPLHLSMKVALRYYFPRCDGVIAISTFLERYYRDKGVPVLRVPPTTDVDSIPLFPDAGNRTGKLLLAYTGNPGRKDLLANMIRAVGGVADAGRPVELRVYGPTPEQVAGLLDGSPLPSNVRVMGRIPQQAVPRALQEADFSIVLRRPERFTQAGFATKFCESMANGTPVIANITGDLATYLRHGQEGLVCRDHSVEGLRESLRTAIALTGEERLRMRQAARDRAMASFDFHVYSRPLTAFFDDIADGHVSRRRTVGARA